MFNDARDFTQSQSEGKVETGGCSEEGMLPFKVGAKKRPFKEKMFFCQPISWM